MKKAVSLLAGIGLVAAIAAPAVAYEAFTGPLGLLQNREGALQGYTLLAPQESKMTYLLDMNGKVVNEWKSDYTCFYAEMLPNGNMLRHSAIPKAAPNFGGSAGLLEEFDWAGKKVWEHKIYTPEKEISHHTFEVMPNGNLLVLIWEHKTYEEALAKGLDPNKTGRTLFPDGVKTFSGQTVKGFWPDTVREVEHGTGKTVWEWRAWDHIGTGPDQIDINAFCDLGNIMRPLAGPDWTHFNGVAFNPKTNEIAITSRNLGEVYIIDYKSNKGIKYRWGNPANYGQGRSVTGYAKDGDQKLWGPHAPDWTPEGTITIMDNGCFRPSGEYTRALELDPKANKVIWEWKPQNVGAAMNNFYSSFQNGAQKLANGNWIITTSTPGHIIEVAPDKRIVWEYANPVYKDGVYALANQHGTNGDSVHKALRYGTDFVGFKGKDMKVKHDLMPAGSPNWVEIFAKSPTVPMPAPKK